MYIVPGQTTCPRWWLSYISRTNSPTVVVLVYIVPGHYLLPSVVVLVYQDKLPMVVVLVYIVPGRTPNGGCPSVHCTRTNSLPPLVVVLVYQDEFFALRWLSHIIGENLTHVCVCLLRPTVSHFEVLLCLYASCVNSKLLED